MDVFSTSLLLPLILDFLKERRHSGESEDFSEFRFWLSENIDRLISESADSFDAIRQSQNLQEGQLEEILKRLDTITIKLTGPSINQLWSALEPNERGLLKRMFSVLRKEPDSDGHVDLGKYSSDAQRLNERGLAQIRESSASYVVALTDAGAVLCWAQLDSEKLAEFEAALKVALPDGSATTRLECITEGLNIPDSLALNYIKLLSNSNLLELDDNTWPPGQSLIYNVTESLRQNLPKVTDVLNSLLPETRR